MSKTKKIILLGLLAAGIVGSYYIISKERETYTVEIFRDTNDSRGGVGFEYRTGCTVDLVYGSGGGINGCDIGSGCAGTTGYITINSGLGYPSPTAGCGNAGDFSQSQQCVADGCTALANGIGGENPIGPDVMRDLRDRSAKEESTVYYNVKP